VKQETKLDLVTLALSVCAHAVLFALLLRLPHSSDPKPVTMEVELAMVAEKTTPVAEFQPEQEPVTVEEPPKPESTPRKIPVQPQVIAPPAPVLAAENGYDQVVPKGAHEPAPPVAAEPVAEVAPASEPAPIASTSEPARPTSAAAQPLQQATPDTSGEVSKEVAWEGYGQLLYDMVGKNKQYPQIAIRRNLQGTVTISARVSMGKVVEINMVDSSGHKVLDEQALKMVKKAVEQLPIQDNLARKSFTVLIPVDFQLDG
jgi:protein TonB